MIKVSQTKSRISAIGRFFPAVMPNGNWAEGLADEQYASNLVIDIDGTKLIWVTLDCIGTGEAYSLELRTRLSNAYNVPVENINIGYTHSHCAPGLGRMGGTMKSSDTGHKEYVLDKVVDGVGQAFKQGLCEVEAYARSYDASGYYSNRNGKEKIGDTEIKLVEFRDNKNTVKGVLLAFACHSTVVNFQNTRMITSDLAGALSRGVEERCGVYPLVMLGAAGDMSNRCCRQGNDFAELKRVSEGILARMDMKVEETKLNLSNLTVTPYQFKETYVTTREERQAQIANIKHRIETAPTDDLRRVFNSALSHAVLEPDGGEFTMDLKGVVVSMGDIKVATMPAELFNRFGLEIKKAMNVTCPIFWGYSNYSVGYLYYKEEAGLSFESAATNIPVGVPEAISEFVCQKVQ